MAAQKLFPFVSPFDPAHAVPSDPEKLRAAVALLHEVHAGRKPVTDLPVRDGLRLRVWKIRRLSCRGYEDMTRVSHGEAMRAMAKGEYNQLAGRATFPECKDALRRGLVAVEGVEVDGTPLELKTEQAPGEQTVLQRETVDAIYDAFGARAIWEIGARVLELSEMGPP